MKIWLNRLALLLVLAMLVLSFVNASWMAPRPKGTLTLIATDTADGKFCVRADAAERAFADGAEYLMIRPTVQPGCLTLKAATARMPRRKFMVVEGQSARATLPTPWEWELGAASTCYNDYFRVGWIGIVPESCRGKTMWIPLDGQWRVWGWPKRFMARMDDAKVRVILSGATNAESAIGLGVQDGISNFEHIPDVPADYTGYLLVSDIHAIGPAIRR
jgi:hypothetical protein